MKKIEWKIEKRKVTDLAPADYNPRVLTDKQKQDLIASISKFGQVEPLVINVGNKLIGGHSRVKVFIDLGIEECDVMVPNRKLDAGEEKELNVRLNKNTGEWDYTKLKQFFNTSELIDFGFGEDELSKFFDKTVMVREDDFDAEAEANSIKNAVTKPGDIWALGNHRLICGDSTNPETYAKLFEGEEKADMCFTDPPYNVNYNHQNKYKKIHKARKGSFAGGDNVMGDNQSPSDFKFFLDRVFTNIFSFSKDSAGIYVCYATKSQKQFFDAFIDAGFHFSQTIIWLKERMILAMGQDYHRVYEPILYGWKEGKKRWSNKISGKELEVWDLDRVAFEERLDVWYLHRDKSADYVHPTQKPVRVPERAIKKSSLLGGGRARAVWGVGIHPHGM